MIKVGDKIKDNDPRMERRGRLVIVEVRPYSVVAENRAGRRFSILTRRIYTDVKPRLSGYSLVQS